jgi:hypothetical protein
MSEIGMQGKLRRLQHDLVVKVRRRLLERQAERYPLLAEEIVKTELEKRPGYYAGEEIDKKDEGERR